MLARFHAPDLAGSATSVTLDAEQSHHLARVLRLRPGDAVRVFDGRGREWEGEVGTGDRRAATVIGLREVAPLPGPAVRITVVAAIVRGGPMDALVHDATMLGAARLVPVLSERVSIARGEGALRAAHARWQRIAVSTSRQCGRATVPDIAAPCALTDAIADASAGVKLWLAEPTLGVEPAHRVEPFAEQARTHGATLAIGPEGGWTLAELDVALRSGFTAWSLGPLVLRAESVPLAALSVLRYAWG